MVLIVQYQFHNFKWRNNRKSDEKFNYKYPLTFFLIPQSEATNHKTASASSDTPRPNLRSTSSAYELLIHIKVAFHS